MRPFIALGLGALLSVAGPASASVRIIPAAQAEAAAGPQVEILSSNDSGVRLTFELPALAAQDFSLDGRSFQGLAIPGGGLRGDVGHPAIPTYSRLVEIPADAAIRVTVTPEEVEEFSGYELVPVQADEGNAFACDASAYSRDDFGTAPLCESGPPAIFRNRRVVNLTFQPVRFNPARGLLRVAGRLRVDLRFEGVDPANAKQLRQSALPASFDRLYRNLILNYSGPESGERVEAGTWLIICANDPAVMTRLQPLLEWRQRQGRPLRLATTAETGTTPAQIKAFIQNAYDTWPQPPEYVVLAGDVSGAYAIPTWYENLSGYGGEGDHPYVQLEGNDVLADAHIGRLSFLTTAELEVIVGKIVGYESNPYVEDPSWYGRACLVGDPSTSGLSTIMAMQWIKTRLRQIGYTQVDTVFTSPFVSQMTTALNRGDTIFSYRGFLGMSGWGNTHTYALSNGWKMPFAVISTCGTGDFAGSTSRSEGFLRAGSVGPPFTPRAGIGAVGTATGGTHTRFNNCYTYGTFQGLLYEGSTELGAAHTRGKMELYINYGQTDQNWAIIFSYWNNLMGDPATPCWISYPAPLTVSHPSSLPVGSNSVSVTVTQGSQPTPGAQVCLWKGLETYVVGSTDAQGRCELPITPATAGSLLLTVSRNDRHPYLATIPVNSTAVYVGCQMSVVDDDNVDTSQGNGDGQVNPGEAVELRVQLKDFGTQPAPGVTAVLTSSDPYVTITDQEEDFGDIGAGSAIWCPDDYDIAVSPACPHGHRLRFNLQIHSGSDQWVSLIEAPVVSADLVGESSILHNAGGNGSLDPGETVGLSVALRNLGGQDAQGVTATLRSRSPYVTVLDSLGSFGDIVVGNSGQNEGDTFTIAAAPGTIPGHLALFALIDRFNSGAADTSEIALTVGTRAVTDPIGPDRHGYYAFDNGDVGYPDAPVYNWIELDPAYGGNGTEIVLGDNGHSQGASRTVALPFTFQFYGQSFTQATVCSNGWLALGATYLTDYRNWSIPGAGAPNNLLAVFWDDLDQQTGGKVYQKYDPINHRWIVEWSRLINGFDSSGPETFQAILYDPAFHPSPSGDGSIVYQYESVSNADIIDGYATTGIQNFDHTDGVLYTYFNLYPAGAAPLVPGRAIRFVTSPSVAASTEEAPGPAYRAAGSRPNPFSGSTRIAFSLDRPGAVMLAVYDIQGRLVRHLLDRSLPAGAQAAIWDGKDDNGSPVASGVYLYTLVTPGHCQTEKILMVE